MVHENWLMFLFIGFVFFLTVQELIKESHIIILEFFCGVFFYFYFWFVFITLHYKTRKRFSILILIFIVVWSNLHNYLWADKLYYQVLLFSFLYLNNIIEFCCYFKHYYNNNCCFLFFFLFLWEKKFAGLYIFFIN